MLFLKQLLYAVLMLVMHCSYFISKMFKESHLKADFPFNSVQDFLPKSITGKVRFRYDCKTQHVIKLIKFCWFFNLSLRFCVRNSTLVVFLVIARVALFQKHFEEVEGQCHCYFN